MGNKVTLNLIDFRTIPANVESDSHFKIESVTNSTRFVAGTYLNETKVTDLCTIAGYEVKIRQVKNSDFK